MSYAEFLEALAACTQYTKCNPYRPMFQRLELLLTEDLFRRISAVVNLKPKPDDAPAKPIKPRKGRGQ